MVRETIQCAVMFADVVGSTAIYDKYGNSIAKSAIGGCVDLMAEITHQFKGVVIKTIGDEIMCRFDNGTAAVNAACSIQEAVNIPFGDEQILMEVRIGLHEGEAILEQNDVFGDAVNVSARVAGIAKARQIITTHGTYEKLSAPLQEKSRKFDVTAVRGKAEKITIYDIMWDSGDDVTRMATSVDTTMGDSSLTILHQGETQTLTPEQVPFTIGRGADANLTTDASFASRCHVRVEFNRGKFILLDQSTNGTYVKLADGKEVYLRREGLPLSSSGWISLGEKVVEGNPSLIHFTVA